MRLTDVDSNSACFFNIDRIEAIETEIEDGESPTTILTLNDSEYIVKETPEQVMDGIRLALQAQTGGAS